MAGSFVADEFITPVDSIILLCIVRILVRSSKRGILSRLLHYMEFVVILAEKVVRG